MSLLIDALKQAEAARAQAQSGTAPAATDGIQLEPLVEQRSSDQAEPTTATQSPSARPAIREPRRARPVTSSAGNVANDAARELFEIKQRAPNRLPIILGAVAGILILGGAAYVWWATQPRSSLMGPGFNAAVATSAPGTPPAVIATQPLPRSDLDTSNASIASAQTSSQPTASTSLDSARQRNVQGDFSYASPARRTRAPAIPAGNDVQPQNRSGISNTTDTKDIHGIQAAYAAFLEGNFPVARQRYQEVLRQDPRSVDAMNALGLIAWRSGQPDVAERMFRAAVHADPKDITAMSQLALLYAEGDPTTAESRLRNLIASQPAAGASYYALGSLLARQQRWSEAQQALFQAYTLDSDNPDVLFNLAICLEHLAQPAVARQFYDRALQASARRPASFDKSVAQSRLQALGSR